MIRLAGILVAIHRFTWVHKRNGGTQAHTHVSIFHPFLLADNRHYVFYAVRWILKPYPVVKYILGGAYLVLAWAWLWRLREFRQKFRTNSESPADIRKLSDIALDTRFRGLYRCCPRPYTTDRATVLPHTHHPLAPTIRRAEPTEPGTTAACREERSCADPFGPRVCLVLHYQRFHPRIIPCAQIQVGGLGRMDAVHVVRSVRVRVH